MKTLILCLRIRFTLSFIFSCALRDHVIKIILKYQDIQYYLTFSANSNSATFAVESTLTLEPNTCNTNIQYSYTRCVYLTVSRIMQGFIQSWGIPHSPDFRTHLLQHATSKLHWAPEATSKGLNFTSEGLNFLGEQCVLNDQLFTH